MRRLCFIGTMPVAARILLAIPLVWGCEPTPPSAAPAQTRPVEASIWVSAPSLPRPVANNAVAGIDLEDGESQIYSFLGIDHSKRWDGVVNWAFRWTVGSQEWEELPPVPGPSRLAATAESVAGRIYVFGGYTVAADGSEASLPNVDILDPATDRWTRGAPIPIPVDDAVSGVWQDSLIVLVSGWHDTDNVADVQIYDPARDSWAPATAIPGTPVFGHAGGVVGDRVVYLGGANTAGTDPRYRIEGSAWMGDMTSDPETTRVEWSSLPSHPGPLRYRAASGQVGEWLVVAGGTDNPYNYNGIGYDGVRSEALHHLFAFHGPSARWVVGPSLPAARMDHRGLGVAGGVVALVGGMDSAGNVTNTVFTANVLALTGVLTKTPDAQPPTQDH